jgi:dihydrofolate reductase
MRADGDARFPPIDAALWREISRTEHGQSPDDAAAFAFVNYRRAEAAPSATVR